VESRSIKCDHCYKELIVDSAYPANYALELSCIDTGVNTSGIVYSVSLTPLLERKHHFCGLKCLKGWCYEYL